MLAERKGTAMIRRNNPLRSVCLLLLAAIVLGTGPAKAQHQAGARLDLALPQGDFSDNLEDPGFGLDGHYAYNVTPMTAFGVYMGYLMYGRETRTDRHPLVGDFNIVTSNNIFSMGLLAQLKGADGPVVPYVEGRFGFQYLWTESKLEDDDWANNEAIAETVNYDDFALVYGGGGGISFRLSQGQGPGNPGVFLDLKVLYLLGANAEYLTEDDIDIDANEEPVFDANESNTDLMHYQLGVSFTF